MSQTGDDIDVIAISNTIDRHASFINFFSFLHTQSESEK